MGPLRIVHVRGAEAARVRLNVSVQITQTFTVIARLDRAIQ
jgi:hypothetical protein